MRRTIEPAGRVGGELELVHPSESNGSRRALFLLLVVQVAFVGAVIGTERTLLPLLAQAEFGLESATAALSFILAFGLTKAPANFLAGRLADRFGRKKILVAGWLIGLPAPLLIALAPTWSWVIAANLLLGVQQGLCWSTLIFMKIDLVGSRRGGFVIGVNELAGYGATAAAAYATGVIAASFGARVVPFLLAEILVVVGLVVALTLPRDIVARPEDADGGETSPRLPFAALAQSGFVIKLTDVAAWGMLPLYFRSRGVPVEIVGLLAAAYPAAWGLLQPATGRLSDHIGRRPLIVVGMLLQSAGLVAVALGDGVSQWFFALIVLGSGTALAYPVLLAAAGDLGPALRRATVIGHYRLWRDLGFVGGALVVGFLADTFGVAAALIMLAGIAAVSGLVVLARWEGGARAAEVP